jgi:hypothetical protein
LGQVCLQYGRAGTGGQQLAGNVWHFQMVVVKKRHGRPEGREGALEALDPSKTGAGGRGV